MKLQTPKKVLILKLGGACNLKCKHCHCANSSYEFNPTIIDYIKNNGYTRVTFCGGEPTLYYDTIKMIVKLLPSSLEYRIVTNATLLTDEMVEFFNTHNFIVVASYDGENDSRDRHLNPNWRTFAKVKKHGISTLYSESNANYLKLHREISQLLEKIGKTPKSLWLNFPHQTGDSPDLKIDRSLANDYCMIIGGAIEADFIRFKMGDRQGLNVLWMAFNKWGKKKTGKGVACCNELKHTLTLDGRFLLCPYGHEYVGDINQGLDYDKVKSYLPKRCKECEQWEYCANTCIANRTDEECYISRVLHRHFFKLMHKHNITYEELAEYEASQ